MNSDHFTEKRHFARILFDAPARISAKGITHACELLDISLKGALIQRPETWPKFQGGDAWLEVDLDHHGSRIRMDAHIVHSDALHLGLQCRHIDVESITHLRRLVELNLGDEAVLMRELEELASAIPP